MKTVNRFIHDCDSQPERSSYPTIVSGQRYFAPRRCPQCGETIYGMPGGRDAVCALCGYKDPCCSD